RNAVPPAGRGAQPPSNGRSVVLPGAVARRASTVALRTSVLVSSATYEPFGPITSLAFGNGTTQTISYNQRYQPTENKLVAGTTTLADYQYDHDPAGNVQSINDVLDPDYNRFFVYDSLNRLMNASSGPKLWGTDSANGYRYDDLGNIVSTQLGTSHTAAFTYATNAQGANLPLISSVVENGVASNVAYDAIGSEVSDGTNTMAYGARELLGSALPNVTAYSYDGFRRRVQTQTANAQQRVSLYDGDNRLLAESAASASPSAVAYDYVYFGDRPIAELDANATHWTFGDHLGTPLIQTDNTASISWQAEHEPYGQVFALRGTDTHQPLRLPGQEAQQFDTGANGLNSLSYNGARWYHPGWGRYSQADPLRMAAGPNPYSYANGRPTVLGDPSGEFATVAGVATCPIGALLNPICDIGLISLVAVVAVVAVAAIAADQMASPPVAQQRAAVDAAVAQSCPNPNYDPNCKDKIDKLTKLAGEMTWRHKEMLTDHRDLFNKAYSVPNFSATGTNTTWLGHQREMSTVHERFWRGYTDAVNAGCLIPPDLFKYLREWPTQPGTEPPAAIP
ncbi:MAG: hypothetical protein M3169_08930, partial [Candidatus Eremiobacteraeota bacterium]|nr:hypothetical protein [Candidatus Eremiobacteraeota bacterium]